MSRPPEPVQESPKPKLRTLLSMRSSKQMKQPVEWVPWKEEMTKPAYAPSIAAIEGALAASMPSEVPLTEEELALLEAERIKERNWRSMVGSKTTGGLKGVGSEELLSIFGSDGGGGGGGLADFLRSGDVSSKSLGGAFGFRAGRAGAGAAGGQGFSDRERQGPETERGLRERGSGGGFSRGGGGAAGWGGEGGEDGDYSLAGGASGEGSSSRLAGGASGWSSSSAANKQRSASGKGALSGGGGGDGHASESGDRAQQGGGVRGGPRDFHRLSLQGLTGGVDERDGSSSNGASRRSSSTSGAETAPHASSHAGAVAAAGGGGGHHGRPMEGGDTMGGSSSSSHNAAAAGSLRASSLSSFSLAAAQHDGSSSSRGGGTPGGGGQTQRNGRRSSMHSMQSGLLDSWGDGPGGAGHTPHPARASLHLGGAASTSMTDGLADQSLERWAKMLGPEEAARQFAAFGGAGAAGGGRGVGALGGAGSGCQTSRARSLSLGPGQSSLSQGHGAGRPTAYGRSSLGQVGDVLGRPGSSSSSSSSSLPGSQQSTFLAASSPGVLGMTRMRPHAPAQPHLSHELTATGDQQGQQPQQLHGSASRLRIAVAAAAGCGVDAGLSESLPHSPTSPASLCSPRLMEPAARASSLHMELTAAARPNSRGSAISPPNGLGGGSSGGMEEEGGDDGGCSSSGGGWGRGGERLPALSSGSFSSTMLPRLPSQPLGSSGGRCSSTPPISSASDGLGVEAWAGAGAGGGGRFSRTMNHVPG